jgi:hypothetical protein
MVYFGKKKWLCLYSPEGLYGYFRLPISDFRLNGEKQNDFQVFLLEKQWHILNTFHSKIENKPC